MIYGSQFSFMINIKTPEIIMRITNDMCIPYEKAFDIFYNSETYKLLCDKETYYWSESALFVTESFLNEYNNLPIEDFSNI